MSAAKGIEEGGLQVGVTAWSSAVGGKAERQPSPKQGAEEGHVGEKGKVSWGAADRKGDAEWGEAGRRSSALGPACPRSRPGAAAHGLSVWPQALTFSETQGLLQNDTHRTGSL